MITVKDTVDDPRWQVSIWPGWRLLWFWRRQPDGSTVILEIRKR